MKKIAIVSPYFGKFPSTIELTFSTMEHNSTIDWIIFTDNTDYNNRYKNIKFIEMTFDDICELIYDKFGTYLSTPYKLCDYRPAYGVMFKEYLEGYDFWGYCDLDVIFGNLRYFFTEEKLNNFDKIYDLGHLSLYRNDDGVSNAFRGSKVYQVPYKDIFNHKYNCIFDENYNENNRGINQVLEKQGFKVYVNRDEIADIDIRYKNFHVHGRNNESDFYFVFDHGELLLKRKTDSTYACKVAYAHYQQRKEIPVNVSDMDFFISTPKGFVDYLSNIENLFFEKGDFSYQTYIKYRLKRYIGKIKAKIWQKKHSDICKYDFKLP